MQKKFRVKTGDNVSVICGKDKGKKGKIIKVDKAKEVVFVKGINLLVKHKKATKTEEGGISKIEGGIHVSNVMHLDPKDGNVTKIGFKFIEDGKKARFSKRSGEIISK